MIICVAFVISREKSIIHILWQCPKVQETIDNFSILCKIIEFKKSLLTSSREINNILLCIKPFFYRSECQNEIMTLQGFQRYHYLL